jgi:hypothetical protein
MLRTRGNTRIINSDSVILLLIVFFGLLIYNNSSQKTTEFDRKPVSTSVSVIDNYAVSYPCLRIQIFQKTSISNKDNFDLLAFNWNPINENKKTGYKVSSLQILRQHSNKIPQFLLRYHQYPVEPGDPIPLS